MRLEMMPAQGSKVRFESLVAIDGKPIAKGSGIEKEKRDFSRKSSDLLDKLDEYIDFLTKKVNDGNFYSNHRRSSSESEIESQDDVLNERTPPADIIDCETGEDSETNLTESIDEIARKIEELGVKGNKSSSLEDGRTGVVINKYDHREDLTAKEGNSYGAVNSIEHVNKHSPSKHEYDPNDESDDDVALGLNLKPGNFGHISNNVGHQHHATLPSTMGKNNLNLERLHQSAPTRYHPDEIPDIDSDPSDDSEVLGVILEAKAKEGVRSLLDPKMGLSSSHTQHNSSRVIKTREREPHLQKANPITPSIRLNPLSYGTAKPLLRRPAPPVGPSKLINMPKPLPQQKQGSMMPNPPHAYRKKKGTPDVITIDVLKNLKTKPSPNWMREAKPISNSDSSLELSRAKTINRPIKDDDPDDEVSLAVILKRLPESSTKMPQASKATRKLRSVHKKATVRVYIEVPTAFQDITLYPTDDCAKVIERIIELSSLNRAQQWALFEINRTLSIGRPIFEWEFPIKIISSWQANRSEDYSLFLEPYPYKPILKPEQVLEKFLTKDGYLYKEVSPKKWKRKYFVLKKGTLYSYSSENSTHCEHSCDLSNRHVYTSTNQSLEKETGKICFFLVSQTPASAFCNKSERVLTFATTSEQGLFSWVTALRVAKAKMEFLTNPSIFTNSRSQAVKTRAEELIEAFKEEKNDNTPFST